MKTNLALRSLLCVLCLSIFISPAVLLADNQTELLPLGPSKYKLLIDKVEKDQIVNTATGKTLSIHQILEETKKTDVFIIGEAHDNYQCHTFQRDFIEALHKKYGKVIVGFEFFWREDNAALEEFRSGKITEEELVKKVGWYDRGGMNYGLTRIITDMIKENKIKTIGVNIPRDIVRQVSRKGFATLSAEHKALFPTVAIPNPEHEYFIKGVFGVMAVQIPSWFKNIYDAQKCWDVVMAESMREMLAKKEYKGYKGVIIAGNNHVAYKLGIPFRYRKASKRTRITTISPILLPKPVKKSGDEEEHPMMHGMGGSGGATAIYSRGIADYVFAAQQPMYYHFPVIGTSVKLKDDKMMVQRVSKGSIAYKQGIRKGDQITSIDGIQIKTEGQFRMLLAQKKWGDTIQMGVIKKIEIKKDDDKKKKSPPKDMGKMMPGMNGKKEMPKKKTKQDMPPAPPSRP